MSTYKPSEGKREEFRRYLEKNGVMDALTKVLVSLYEEADKPEDALEYIRDKLAYQAGLETLGQMSQKYEDALTKISQLEEEINGLKAALAPPESEEPIPVEPTPEEVAAEQTPEDTPQ